MTPPEIGVSVPTVLLPVPSVDASTWAVVACDQFTSEPDYWERVDATVGDAPSTLRMILPELYLNSPDVDARIARAQASMREYLDAGLLAPRDAFVYVERTLGEKVQHGLVVALDLEAYDYSAGSQTLVRATEGTVLDRIPPRMKVRRGAELELPHIMVLYDDPEGVVLRDVRTAAPTLPLAYDTELMEGSGHLTGRYVDDQALTASVLNGLASLIEPGAYRARYDLPADAPLLFAMGDGNHSLATAKAIWEELKAAGAASDHPARHALVELVNLHEDSLQFEPIHRVLFGAGHELADALHDAFGSHAHYSGVGSMAELTDAVAHAHAPSQRFGMVEASGYTLVELDEPEHELAVGSLQAFLDAYLGAHPGVEIDYVHGDDVVDALARKPKTIGFVLPGIGKDAFFKSIAVDGALPRKTFSMGHAKDKRFYMECRRLN